MKPIPTGRFAPTPSGSLHFGSLVAALASYLNVKSQLGRWYVRIDDIDQPRIAKNSINDILNTLEFLNLEWDGEVYYQSQHIEEYQAALDKLKQQKLAYACTCTRKQIGESIYTGTCRDAKHELTQRHSLRIKTNNTSISLNDCIQGAYSQNLFTDIGDFIILRSDNIFSYHLSTVIDDTQQNITEIIRGYDLLESTPRQMYLRECLGLTNPNYCHIPLAMKNKSKKLSKQNFASPIEKHLANESLFNALVFLGQNPEQKLQTAPTNEIVEWALIHWDINSIPQKTQILTS